MTLVGGGGEAGLVAAFLTFWSFDVSLQLIEMQGAGAVGGAFWERQLAGSDRLKYF